MCGQCCVHVSLHRVRTAEHVLGFVDMSDGCVVSAVSILSCIRGKTSGHGLGFVGLSDGCVNVFKSETRMTTSVLKQKLNTQKVKTTTTTTTTKRLFIRTQTHKRTLIYAS